jgi:hypothetical protein
MTLATTQAGMLHLTKLLFEVIMNAKFKKNDLVQYCQESKDTLARLGSPEWGESKGVITKILKPCDQGIWRYVIEMEDGDVRYIAESHLELEQ